jgi:hypothetical protein
VYCWVDFLVAWRGILPDGSAERRTLTANDAIRLIALVKIVLIAGCLLRLLWLKRRLQVIAGGNNATRI